MKPSWVESLLHQCRAVHVPFFFKQWGGVQKKKNGRKLHGRTYDQFPGIEVGQIPDAKNRRHIAEQLQAQYLKNDFSRQQIVLKAAV